MNIAGVHRLPIVFLCRNNQYAISLPLEMQTASKTIAVKAEAYGFPGQRIDGNDASLVYSTVHAALERARRGKGPALIEAIGYRLAPHTTSDDAKRYRSDEQLKDWRQRDGIQKLRQDLESAGLWDAERDRSLHQELSTEIDRCVERALREAPPEASTLFDDVFADIPPYLRRQKMDLLGGATS
jgi:TPP-dependent pyruvate/acetoin dehydrogenase alpha subunit